jgi:hypothetical protein
MYKIGAAMKLLNNNKLIRLKLIAKSCFVWWNKEHMISIIIMPLIISYFVSWDVGQRFNERQLKKELSLKITTLQDDIFKYDEIYIIDSPFQYLISLLNQNIKLDNPRVEFDRKVLQKSILSAKGTTIDKELSQFLLDYLERDTTESHVYSQLLRSLEHYKRKYQTIKMKLKLIESKIDLLNNELQCSQPNLLNKLFEKFKKREELNNVFYSNMQEQIEKSQLKKNKEYSAVLTYKISPLYVIDELANKKIIKQLEKNDDEILELMNQLLKINDSFLINYRNEIVDYTDYCAKLSLE